MRDQLKIVTHLLLWHDNERNTLECEIQAQLWTDKHQAGMRGLSTWFLYICRSCELLEFIFYYLLMKLKHKYTKLYPLWRIIWSLKKLKIVLPYDTVILLLEIYPEKMKTVIWKATCTSMFIEALFTIAKTWKQMSTDRWITKEDVVCIHNGILLRHKKE